MANGNGEPLDFSDLGGRRIWPPAEKLDFSDLGGRRIGEETLTEGYFTRFVDLGASVEHHPEWLMGWTLSAPSAQPQQQSRPLDFGDLGGRRIWPPTEKLDFSDLGGRRVGEAQPDTPIRPTQAPAQPASMLPKTRIQASSGFGNQEIEKVSFNSAQNEAPGMRAGSAGGQLVKFAQPVQSKPDKPGFSQRWAEGMNIPVTQEQEDALREEMKPKWYDLVAPQWRGLKMVGGMVGNAARQLYEGGKEAYQEGRSIKTPADVIPALTRTYVSGQEHLLKAAPGGEQLWNYGQDVNDGNWRGAAGGATAAFLQAGLADALFGEGSSVRKPAAKSVAPIISPEEAVRPPRPGKTAMQLSLWPESESIAPTSSTSLEALTARANEIHNLLDHIAKRNRTTAALGTHEGKVIIGGGGRDLDRVQYESLKPEEIEARLPGEDAEITVLEKAFELGFRPKALATSRPICPTCRPYIEATGGKLTSRTTAVWPE